MAMRAPIGEVYPPLAERAHLRLESMSDDMHQLGTVASLLRDRRISSEELVRNCLSSIEAGSEINAVVELDPDSAIWSSREADRQLRAGSADAKPLCGIPVTVKRTFEVRGFSHSEHDVDPGSAYGAPAGRDAAVVAQLRAAGAIVIGRSNAPPRAADIDTWHPLYGRTTHPIAAELSPGGSSGGSAAAVAAGHTLFDVGSDDAGSARIPAHACGVFALRPTLGNVSSVGHVPGPVNEFDVREMLTVCPITRSAADLSFVWNALRAPAEHNEGRPERYPIAAFLDSEAAQVSSEVAASLAAAIERLRSAGHQIVDTGLPVGLPENWLLCQQLLYSENPVAESFAGESSAPLAEPTAEAAPIEIALWCAGISYQLWRQLRRKRAGFQSRWQKFFSRYSALLLPVMGTTALPPRSRDVPLLADELTIGQVDVPVFALSIWCAVASVAGLPAVSMPVCPAASGLPVGLQVVAGHGQEQALLSLVQRFAAELSPVPFTGGSS